MTILKAIAVKERPILFSGNMVRAILAGRKTQTRRVCSPSIVEAIENIGGRCDGEPTTSADIGLLWAKPKYDDGSKDGSLQWLVYGREYPEEGCIPIGQGYGAPGDRLWVREAWAAAYRSVSRENGEVCYFKWDKDTHGSLTAAAIGLSVHYRADGADENPAESYMPHGNEIGWKPSIHLPRWASRITLEIVNIRIERLQEINVMDAWSEGCPNSDVNAIPDWFIPLWNSINAECGHGWAENPWVWVIEFQQVTAEGRVA